MYVCTPAFGQCVCCACLCVCVCARALRCVRVVASRKCAFTNFLLVAYVQWDLALKVAEQHQVPGIDKLLSTYVVSLLGKKKVFAAIQLYMKAKQHLEAARLVFKVNCY